MTAWISREVIELILSPGHRSPKAREVVQAVSHQDTPRLLLGRALHHHHHQQAPPPTTTRAYTPVAISVTFTGLTSGVISVQRMMTPIDRDPYFQPVLWPEVA